MQRLGWFSLAGGSTEGRRFAEWLDSSGGWVAGCAYWNRASIHKV